MQGRARHSYSPVGWRAGEKAEGRGNGLLVIKGLENLDKGVTKWRGWPHDQCHSVR